MAVPLRIVVPAYNCARWIERCVRSIRGQRGVAFRCIVIDDASTDRTARRLEHAVDGDPRFESLRRSERHYQLANRLEGIRRIATDAEDVVVHVDGDDWLLGTDALEQIAAAYADPAVWLTYGSYRSRKRQWWRRMRLRPRAPSTRAYDASVWQEGSLRRQRWWAGHPMTFRRFLYDQIDDADLRDLDGTYYRAATDQALFMPMLEMAGPAHLCHLRAPLYVWNKANPESARPAYRALQRHATAHVRARPPYARIRAPDPAEGLGASIHEGPVPEAPTRAGEET